MQTCLGLLFCWLAPLSFLNGLIYSY
jgi:hypothetical protein